MCISLFLSASLLLFTDANGYVKAAGTRAGAEKVWALMLPHPPDHGRCMEAVLRPSLGRRAGPEPGQ